jgi:SAM-dependent methyltransferase
MAGARAQIGIMIAPDFKKDDARSLEIYREWFRTHGVDTQAVGWSGPAMQQLRFSVLTSIADLQGARILDVGCGLGDFHGWLCDRGLSVDFTGIDASAEFVEAASHRFPEAKFFRSDIVADNVGPDESFDYVFASGIFTFRKTEPMRYLKLAVERMFSICRKGVAFNSLSSWGDRPGDGEFEPSPAAVLELCREITPLVTLRHDYHRRDMTLYLYKPAQS